MDAIAPFSESQYPHTKSSGMSGVRRTAAPKRVLVVEDYLDAMQSMVNLLRDMGHEVDYAINGYVAIEVARKFRPDFVLLDLGLPGMDGFDVCKRLKREPGLEQTHFIAVTGYSREDFRTRSLAAGCELHLIKPVSPRVLEELLG
jgi:CheY-like chemotaxis protein